MEIEVIEQQVEELEQEEVIEVEQEDPEVGAEAEQPEDEGDVVVLIGDEPAPDEETEIQAAPKWVKELRKSQRELQKENRELKAQLTQAKPKEEVPALGAEPTLEDCDYDADEFKRRYAEYLGRKQQIEAAEREQQQAEEERKKAWNVKVEAYNGAKAKLKVRDYDDAEEVAFSALPEIRQQIVIAYAKDPALMMYAIGKNPKEAARLAAITDHIEFAIEMRDLEKKMKVEKRKPATQPESTITGTAPKSGAVDNQLERLRAEAAKTGDYSKVTQYKKQLKDKQRA